MYSSINVLLKLILGIVSESFHNRDLDNTGSCDEPGAGAPLVPLHRGEPLGESFEEEGANIIKTYTTRRPLCPKH